MPVTLEKCMRLKADEEVLAAFIQRYASWIFNKPKPWPNTDRRVWQNRLRHIARKHNVSVHVLRRQCVDQACYLASGPGYINFQPSPNESV